MLAGHHEVRGIAHSGKELLELLERTPVDGVLLDLSMPDQSGLDVLPHLKKRWPGLKIVILTMHADRTLADATLGMGAHAYVPKDACLEEMLAAIDAVFTGKQYISPRVPKHTERTSLHAAHLCLATLTPRQEEILLMLAEGRSSAEIAQAVGLSESTITFHRANMRRKLGIKTELGLHEFAVLVRATLAEKAGRALGKDSRPKKA